MTITHDALDLIVQPPQGPISPPDMGPHCILPPPPAYDICGNHWIPVQTCAPPTQVLTSHSY